MATSALTADLPLAALTQQLVRDRVAGALRASTLPDIKDLASLVRVDAADINFTSGKSLAWSYQVKPGKTLTNAERTEVEKKLRAILTHVLTKDPSGNNLNPRDLETLQKQVVLLQRQLTPVPVPLPPPVEPRLSAAEKEVQALKKALQEADQKLAAQQKTLAALEAQLTKLMAPAKSEADIKKLTQLIDDRVAGPQKKLTALEAQLVKSMAASGKSEADIKKLTQRIDDRVAEQQKKRTALEAQLVKLMAASGKSEADIKRLTQLIDDRVAGPQKRLEAQLVKLMAASGKSEADIKKLTQMIDDRVAEQQKKLTALETQLVKIMAAGGKSEEEIKKLAQQAMRLKKETEKLGNLAADNNKKTTGQIVEVAARLNFELRMLGDRVARLQKEGQAQRADLKKLEGRENQTAKKLNAEAAKVQGRMEEDAKLNAQLRWLVQYQMPWVSPDEFFKAPALVTVQLPSEACLFIDNVPCPLTSSERTFFSPPLEVGVPYHYILRAEMGQGKDQRKVVRQVPVEAGKYTLVDMTDLEKKN